MALHLHRAERTDVLADGLGDLLATPLEDPFAEELVVVPAKGVERWLSQRLAHVLGAGPAGDGVCAGVEFSNPRSLVAELTGTTDDDPWAPDAMAWPLLAMLDAASTSRGRAASRGTSATPTPAPRPSCGRVAAMPSPAGWPASSRRTPPSGRRCWPTGSTGGATDGVGGDLDPDLAWQPPLWRALVDRRRRPAAARAARRRAGPAARRAGRPAAAALALRPHPAARHRARAARRAGRPTTTYTCGCRTPASTLWQALADLGRARSPRRDDVSHRRVGHPLLATLGRDMRELQRGAGRRSTPSTTTTRARPPADTLLGWLQPDLRADAARPEGRVLAADDRSRPGAQLSRLGPPGRRAARGAARPAPGRPDPRAARHPRHVPRHRDLRAADHGRLRPR